MNTSTKPIGINGSPSLNNFEIKIGEIPNTKYHMANKLKDLVLLSSLVAEKNSMNDMVTFSFAGFENEIYSVQKMLHKPFSELKVPQGSIVACNFEIYISNIGELFEREPDFKLDGIICPQIDGQSIGFLKNHNPEIFIRADQILSRRRENIHGLFRLNQNNIPYFNPKKGETYSDLVFAEVQKFI